MSTLCELLPLKKQHQDYQQQHCHLPSLVPPCAPPNTQEVKEAAIMGMSTLMAALCP